MLILLSMSWPQCFIQIEVLNSFKIVVHFIKFLYFIKFILEKVCNSLHTPSSY